MSLEHLRLPLASVPDPLELPGPVPRGSAGFEVTVRPPGSKSLTNRALLLAALGAGRSVLRNALVDADDAQRMVEALRALGAVVQVEGDRITVDGVGGRWRVPPGGVVLNLNNAGTATRFLAAAALLSPAPVTIDGNARMRERPIGELGSILQTLGARVEFLAKPGCPPIRVTPPENGELGHSIEIPTTQSSQFISALLLVAPWLTGGMTVRLSGEVTSASYVEMTVGLLQRLGATVRTSAGLRVVRVGGSAESAASAGLPPFEYDVEPDASGATYFLAAAAMVPGARCVVPGLGEGSLQGDTAFADLLARMGAAVVRGRFAGEPGIEVRGPTTLEPLMADMADMPDAAMTLAAAASFAHGPSLLRGVRTLRVKESDRIEAMRRELAKIGVVVRSPVAGDGDAMSVEPPAGGVDCSPACPRVAFDTYDDHRIAMALSLLALRRPRVAINHPQCVAKTYATYWRDFAMLLAC